jgi:hypothetical protein
MSSALCPVLQPLFVRQQLHVTYPNVLYCYDQEYNAESFMQHSISIRGQYAKALSYVFQVTVSSCLMRQ